MPHSTEIPHVATFEELGKEMAHLRYDALLVVLENLGAQLQIDALNDQRNGRSRLATYGVEASVHINTLKQPILEMLRLSIPHMRSEIAKTPLLVDLP